MPSIIDGRVSHRPYTRSETATRITHLFHNPRLLTPREVVCGIYLAYVAYVALLTLRSLGFLIFEADGREMWCPAAPPVPAWYLPGWKVEMSRWDCFQLLRWMMLRRVWALAYEVFAWGFVGALGAFVVEEGLRWARGR
ncbi:hypothetical protein ColTof4_06606 [Colletotrichum tofieldiae]|nr:hypothetical protein ColTof3_11573 [Colletotrichum tofieldiae]GKT74183.1 hypothetical protein ColTof4_06606 [Colletotrichum tofieldiae]